MKTQSPRVAAFTLVELILVVAVLGLLATLLVRAQAGTESRVMRDRVACVSNLKQVGLGFLLWLHDHETEKFSMQTPAAKEGSLEAIDKGEPWRHFQVISNELASPRILACPADDRKPATNFLSLTATNISYFVGLDAVVALDVTRPLTILAGDRNVTNGIAPKKGVIELTDTPPAGWTGQMHNEKGNIGLSDGSVQRTDTPQLRRQVAAANASLKTGKTRLQLPLAPAKP